MKLQDQIDSGGRYTTISALRSGLTSAVAPSCPFLPAAIHPPYFSVVLQSGQEVRPGASLAAQFLSSGSPLPLLQVKP